MEAISLQVALHWQDNDGTTTLPLAMQPEADALPALDNEEERRGETEKCTGVDRRGILKSNKDR
jgi:hypothetical protein